MQTIRGKVVHGLKNGREFGFPTANVVLPTADRPPFGVYAVFVEVHDGPHAGSYLGCASIGTKPTVGDHLPNLEVFLIDFDGDLYGREISVDLAHYQRPEKRFASIESLIAQMGADVCQARRTLSALGSDRHGSLIEASSVFGAAAIHNPAATE